jgi:predicted GIY-YIG superfamily endonuclease
LKTSEPPSFHVYILLCSDGSLYTGIAKDVDRRVALHTQGRGARYTRSRGVLALVYREGPYGHGDALRRERFIKTLSRKAKEQLIGSYGLGKTHKV